MEDKASRDHVHKSILELPKELLDHINGYLPDSQDLQNVRLTGQNELAWSADKVMLKRLNPLYIECTGSSIDQIQTLIANPERLRYVTQIVQMVTLRKPLPKKWTDDGSLRKAIHDCRPSVAVANQVSATHASDQQEQDDMISTGEFSVVLERPHCEAASPPTSVFPRPATGSWLRTGLRLHRISMCNGSCIQSTSSLA